MHEEFYQIVYRSTYRSGRIDNTLHALREIVKSSSHNNARLGITGYLIFDGDTFLQILEGPRIEVMGTFSRIETDLRHRDAVIVQSRTIKRRDFSAWAMGGVLRATAMPAALSGEDAVEFAKALASGKADAA